MNVVVYQVVAVLQVLSFRDTIRADEQIYLLLLRH